MDASKLTQMKMEAANTYRSYWQPRDASEVTLRKQTMAQKNNASQHHGPDSSCASVCKSQVQSADPPTKGFSTDYSQDTVTQKPAGCANCNDVAWGAPYGVTLKSCAEVRTILQEPSNPIKRAEAFWGPVGNIPVYCVPCADPGLVITAKAAQIDSNNIKASPAYSGWRNQVPVSNKGITPIQVPLYPSH